MADVKISVLMEDSGSIKKKTGDTRELNGELTKTQKLARSAFASQSGGSAPSGAELETYNKVRGAAGTGAAGRDFANQAQGLGGVVRLYATFAANIFAVSAAFQNLQQAANFERLIQASKMMSQQVGTDLLRLGKNLQSATGYAISFEDAMQFANLGTSAGIAAKQMESLVAIAKGAAVGLGRDVNDAVRRIIQGTAKQEQEILDELGIFIKAKKAYDDYAKKFQIQGGADALSAQQRVAAYANAVEQAGGKWKEFATLDDPFSRFVATGKEALFTILTFINQGIKPLLSFLADSKEAIIALSLAISGALLKRALPELKNIVLDFFTFNSARAKAQAAEFRIGIAREMAQISNSIQAEQTKLAALAANTQKITMAAVAGTLAPGMLAQTTASGRAKGPGIAPRQLEKQIFGAKGELDLLNYTKVEQLEKKYEKAIDATVAKNQVKLDQMIKMGVLQSTSTLNELRLGDAIKKSAAEVFNTIELRRAGLISEEQARQRILGLSAKQAQLDTQFQTTTPGQVQRVGRRYGQDSLPPTAAAPAGAAGAAAVAAGAFMAAAIPATKGFSQGLGQASREAERLQGVVGGGLKVNLQSLSDVLADQYQILKNGASTGAKFGAAVGAMGTIVSAAFRGILAAFGPLMIIWTLWELFGDKIVPKAVKESKELDEKLKNVANTFENSGAALERVSNSFKSATLTNEEYAKSLDIASNAVTSQIEALKELKKKREEAASKTAIDIAKQQAAARGEIFDEYLFGLDKTIAATEALGQADNKNLVILKQLRQEHAELLKQANKAKVQASTGMMMASTAAGPGGFGMPLIEVSPSLSGKQLAESQLKALAPLEATQAAREQARAQASQATAALEEFNKAFESYEKKMKGVKSVTEYATNEIAQGAVKVFKGTENALKNLSDGVNLTKTKNELMDLFARLEPTSKIAAAALNEVNTAQQDLFNPPDDATILQILQKFFIPLLKELSNTTKKYTDQAAQGFLNAQSAIDVATASIMKFDMEIAKTGNMNKMLQDMRGFSTESEIAAERGNQITKAAKEYNKELQQIALELAKVENVQDKTREGYKEELDSATQRANAARTQARLSLDNKILTADIGAENNKLSSILQQISFRYEEIGRRLDVQLAKTAAALKIEQTRFNVLKDLEAYSPTQAVGMESDIQTKEIGQQYDKAIQQSEKLKNQEFDRLQAQFEATGKTAAAKDAMTLAQIRALDVQKSVVEQAKIERDTALEVLRITTFKNSAMAKLAEETEKLNRSEALKDVRYDTEMQLLDIRKEELSLALSMGTITQEVYNKENTSLERSIRQKEYRNKLDKINFEYSQKELSLDTRERTAIALVGPEGAGQVQEQFNKDREAEKALRDAKLQGAEQSYNANEKLRDQMADMGSDQMKLRDIYQSTFASMGDALVEFVRTGKLNFKGLIADMLAQIAKMYMNKMFMSLFSSIFGMPSFGGSSVGFGIPSGVQMAKGGAFDAGVIHYAKGGMFTNSIVDSPTLFKFAKGTGLMGEAGPEAIMPLKRDSQGNLGVRAQNGGNVEVVVNNYSTAQAQTKETTDSRGNRRIEVVVGDMTAGEITRTGSSSQRAIGGTFGLQPQLIRR